jgi:hypothetical protein
LQRQLILANFKYIVEIILYIEYIVKECLLNSESLGLAFITCILGFSSVCPKIVKPLLFFDLNQMFTMNRVTLNTLTRIFEIVVNFYISSMLFENASYMGQ